MRVVLLGSGSFTLPVLQALTEGVHELAAVVCQPDRRAGRGHTFTPPPVKVAAAELGVTLVQPENVNEEMSLSFLKSLEADVFVVAAYGQILRQRVLDLPKRGSLNVHASLLPRHRGAAPVAAAILAGDETSGVTIMEVVRALDAGPIVASSEEPVLPYDTTESLTGRLAERGAELLKSVLEPWFRGELIATPQDESQASYAPQIRREEARLDWHRPARELWRRTRAFIPWPVAFTTWQGLELRILEAEPLPSDAVEPQAPGTVLATRPSDGVLRDSFAVETGEGVLAVKRLQQPGRRAQSGRDFLNGHRNLVGSRFD